MFLYKKSISWTTWDSFWTVCPLTKPIGDKTHLKKKKLHSKQIDLKVGIFLSFFNSFFLLQYKVTFFAVVMVYLLSFLFGLDQPRRLKRERWTWSKIILQLKQNRLFNNNWSLILKKRPRVNFINILWAAFTHAKVQKKDNWLEYFLRYLF